MKSIIHVGDTPVVLISQDIEDELDIDRLTSIDYSNIYGEAITISALLNKVGLLKAEAEKYHNLISLKCDIYEADLRKRYRREANKEGGKFSIDGESVKLTEKSLEEGVLLDKGYQELKKEFIESKKDVALLDSWFWAVQDKSKKLNNIVKPITPEEFISEIIEGEINTFFIKKAK